MVLSYTNNSLHKASSDKPPSLIAPPASHQCRDATSSLSSLCFSVRILRDGGCRTHVHFTTPNGPTSVLSAAAPAAPGTIVCAPPAELFSRHKNDHKTRHGNHSRSLLPPTGLCGLAEVWLHVESVLSLGENFFSSRQPATRHLRALPAARCTE